jgi:cystinosin
MPSVDSTLSSTAEAFPSQFSSLLGWIYFICWSASFYPQALLLYRKKSSLGLSLDLVMYNVVGFLCYTVNSAIILTLINCCCCF